MKTTNKDLGLICALAIFAIGINVSASNEKSGDKQKKEQKEIQYLTFEELKVACEKPAQFHNQTAPANIQVSCRDIQYKWVPEDRSAIDMTNSRGVTTSVISDKYTVSPNMDRLEMPSQKLPCHTYKEIAETVESIKSVSCADLIEFKGTEIEYCTDAIDALRASNPESLNVTDTGNKADLCSVKLSKQKQGK